jgi:hypothetical protein
MTPDTRKEREGKTGNGHAARVKLRWMELCEHHDKRDPSSSLFWDPGLGVLIGGDAVVLYIGGPI